MTAGQPVRPDSMQAGVPTAAERAAWSLGGVDPLNDEWAYIIEASPNPDGTSEIVGWCSAKIVGRAIADHNETIRLLDALDAAEAALREIARRGNEWMDHPDDDDPAVASLACALTVSVMTDAAEAALAGDAGAPMA